MKAYTVGELIDELQAMVDENKISLNMEVCVYDPYEFTTNLISIERNLFTNTVEIFGVND